MLLIKIFNWPSLNICRIFLFTPCGLILPTKSSDRGNDDINRRESVLLWLWCANLTNLDQLKIRYIVPEAGIWRGCKFVRLVDGMCKLLWWWAHSHCWIPPFSFWNVLLESLDARPHLHGAGSGSGMTGKPPRPQILINPHKSVCLPVWRVRYMLPWA